MFSFPPPPPEKLYVPSDNVVILTDDNFTGSKITSGFKGPGVLKAYATWCGFCRQKVESFKLLSDCFKKEKIGLVVYVIEAAQNPKFAKACEIEAFPTIMYADETGKVARLFGKGGDSVHDVVGAIDALCNTKKKCVKTYGRKNGRK
jgi:thiol-disulfide isomerase/thioredoxin